MDHVTGNNHQPAQQLEYTVLLTDVAAEPVYI